MKCLINSLLLPTDYEGLIAVSHSTWVSMEEELRPLRIDMLNDYVKQSLIYLQELARSEDDTNRLNRLTLGLTCIFHFFLNNISEIEDLISLLYNCPDPISMQFGARCIAMISGALPPNDDTGFSRRHLEYAFSLIKAANKNKQSLLMGLYLLRELASFIPLAFLLQCQDIENIIWPYLIHKSSKIRSASAQVLSKYLNVIVKYQGYKLKEIFDFFEKNAIIHLLSYPNNSHPQGALTVIFHVLKGKNHYNNYNNSKNNGNMSDSNDININENNSVLNQNNVINNLNNNNSNNNNSNNNNLNNNNLNNNNLNNNNSNNNNSNNNNLNSNNLNGNNLKSNNLNNNSFNNGKMDENNLNINLDSINDSGNNKNLSYNYFSLKEIHEIYAAVQPFLSSKKNIDARAVAISVIAQLAIFDSKTFIENFQNQNYFDTLFGHSNDDIEPIYQTVLDFLVVIIKNVPEITAYDQVPFKIYQICRLTIEKRNTNEKYVQSMFNVLEALAQTSPSTLTSTQHSIILFDLWSLVTPFIVSDSFIHFLPTLLRVAPNLIYINISSICEKIISTLETKPSLSNIQQKVSALTLIQLVPANLFNEKCLKSLLLILKSNYMHIKSEIPRSLAPRCLLHIMSAYNPDEIPQVLHQIIEMATGDDSIVVRVECLLSFTHQHFPYLVKFLHFFRTLSNDVSPKVRSACFDLLMLLREFSPLNVDIILRRSLINTFYSLQCSNTLMMQVKNAQVLPSLVSASPSLFRTYLTTYIPIILNLLSQRFAPEPTFSMNPLDPDLRSQFALSLIQALHKIVNNDYQLLATFESSLVITCITILGEWGDKLLKHAVLSMFFDYVSNSVSPSDIVKKSPEMIPTLFSLIENCNSRSLRVQCLKLIGLCGALSPKKFSIERLNPSMSGRSSFFACSDPDLPDLFLVGTVISFNDYFLKVVFKQLKQILEDKSLRNLKVKALSAVIEALNTRSTNPGDYLQLILPILLTEVEGDYPKEGLSLLQKLIDVSGHRIVKFVNKIMKTLHKIWSIDQVSGILSVVASLVDQVGSDFMPYATKLIINLLDVLSISLVVRPDDAIRCIPLLATICPSFPHLPQLIIPHICSIALTESANDEVKHCSLNSLRFLVQTTIFENGEGNISSILRVSLFYCSYSNKSISDMAFQVLYSLIVRLGQSFNLYTARVVEKLEQHKILNREFLQLSSSLVALSSSAPLKLTDFKFIDTQPLLLRESSFQVLPKNRSFDEHKLIDLFKLTNNIMTTPKHWQSWFHKVVLAFIKESPSISISCCYDVAALYLPLATNIFFPAFMSCWIYMNEDSQASISLLIQLVLAKQIPQDVLQSFARLCEYMDRAEKPLSISQRSLTQIFSSAQCYASALHNEQERLNSLENSQPIASGPLFAADLKQSIVELYASLGKSGSAKTLLQRNGNPEEWLMKLGQWGDAFSFFKEKLSYFPESDEGFVGYIASCGKLRKYELIRNSEETLLLRHNTSKEVLTKSAQDFADAFFFGGNFDKMLEYSKKCSSDSVDGFISRALSLIMLNENDEALKIIDTTFALIAAQSSALFSRRYETIYPTLLRCQVTYELHEIALSLKEEKSNHVNIAQKEKFTNSNWWTDRLKSVEYMSDTWWPLIMVRMALKPHRDENSIFLFLELLLHERRFDVFESTFRLFYPNFSPQKSDEFVTLQYLKYIWATSDRKKALNNLGVLLRKASPSTCRAYPSMFKSYIDWTLTINGRDAKLLEEVIRTLKPILCLPKQTSYIVWQRWATINYHMFKQSEEHLANTPKEGNSSSNCINNNNSNNILCYAIEAIKGYIYYISLVNGSINNNSNSNNSKNNKNNDSNSSNFSEIVQLLSLFFATSNDENILNASKGLMARLSSSIFIEAIPQLIAQLSHENNDTVLLVEKFLLEIVHSDYQSLTFPLLVSKMSPNLRKREASERLLDEISRDHPKALKEAIQMQKSLLLAATTIFEHTKNSILTYFDQISSLNSYSSSFSSSSFSSLHQTQTAQEEDNDYNKCAIPAQTLLQMQKLMVNPKTAFDRLLHQVTFMNLQQLLIAIKELPKIMSQKESLEDFYKMIEPILKAVLSDIDKFMDKLTTLLVSDVCPDLIELIDTEIAVPGFPLNTKSSSSLNSPNPMNSLNSMSSSSSTSSLCSSNNNNEGCRNNYVKIKSFHSSFEVLGSKKRPRKTTIVGNDGQTYRYLLKGNEDLRLDQRVMQFFHLINTQIRHDYSLSIDNVTIRVYVIVPLSPEVGLIQWVEGSDTFHNLITEYRIAHKIDTFKEYNSMSDNSIQSIDSLCAIQRFEQLLVETTPENNANKDDLRKIFWLKSISSDEWLEKITKFARSTALISIVGYILGLGDRHPSNFMIDRNSGDVIHIDFGDSFEVAMNRILFPEHIPFRLTRMMLSAFGVCGIEADFRPVAERAMMLVRENSNSLVSVLEIFVQEPIKDVVVGGASYGSCDDGGNEKERELRTKEIMPRIWQKILGTDFEEEGQKVIPVFDQVDRLIKSAMDQYNLSLLYSGWCPLW